MKEKLLEWMKNEGLKPGQFAELLDITPASVSHMMAGRNKPGFDLLRKMLLRFPHISPDWLLLDKGPMLRADVQPTSSTSTDAASSSTSAATTTSSLSGDLFASPSSLPTTSQSSVASSSTSAEALSPSVMPGIPLPQRPSGSTAAVRRVVIFLEDGTCETYTIPRGA